VATARRPLWFAAVVLLGFVAWVAADLWIPIVAAALLAFVLRPFVRALQDMRVPAWLGALVIVASTTAAMVGAVYLFYTPASEAMDDLPRAASRVSSEVREIKEAYFGRNSVSETLEVIEQLSAQPTPVGARVMVERPTLEQRLMDMGMTAFTASLAALLLVYFFLVHGDTLLRRLVEVTPTLRDKKRTVDMVRAVQGDVSRYMLSITVINLLVGAVVGVALLLLGVENALFWGFLAGLLNFIPYLGPLIMSGALLLVGFGDADAGSVGMALAPALTYGALHVVESNGLTPLLLGRQFSINPVVILLWLMLWGWLWGIAGLLFGVPMLVITKVLLQRSDDGHAWATLMETRRSGDASP
jgi:predicted PurR-regulated permease PerM